MFLPIRLDAFVFNSFGFHSASDARQQHPWDETLPAKSSIEFFDLQIGSGRSAVLVERVAADAKFVSVIQLQVEDFVEVMLGIIFIQVAMFFHGGSSV